MKKNKKGFTLVELLGVIIILALIFALALPSVINILRKAEIKIDDATKKVIVDATEDYLSKNTNIINNDYYCIKILDLIENGFIDQELLESLDSYDYYMKIDKDNNKKDYKIVDKCNPMIHEINLTSNSNTITVEVLNDLSSDEVTKYYYSLDNKNFVESNNNVHVFINLNENTEYTVYVKIKNEDNKESEVYAKTIKTKKFNNPEIKLINTPTTSHNGYFKKQEAVITFKANKFSNPLYYIKSSKAGKTNLNVLASCGTGSTPGTCTPITNTKDISKDTWYQVSGNINVVYENTITTNENIYVMVYDGNSYAGSASSTLGKIDADVPTVTIKTPVVKTNSITLNYELKDVHSGIDSYTCKYGTVKDNYTSVGDANETTCSFSKLEAEKTYYYQICAKDKVGNNEVCQTGSASTPGINNPVIVEASK